MVDGEWQTGWFPLLQYSSTPLLQFYHISSFGSRDMRSAARDLRDAFFTCIHAQTQVAAGAPRGDTTARLHGIIRRLGPCMALPSLLPHLAPLGLGRTRALVRVSLKVLVQASLKALAWQPV